MDLTMRRILILTAVSLISGCSPRKIAIENLGTALGDAISKGGTTYSRDDDPELIKEAGPAALKTIEALIDESPKHPGLLLTAKSGFTQYAFAYVQCEADYVESQDLARATELRARARALYRRAMGYGLRGIESRQPGFGEKLRTNADSSLAPMRKADVPFLFWTGNAWGALISLSTTDADAMADLPLVAAIMRRALELDEGFSAGSIHDFFIAYEGGLPAAAGGSAQRARHHFARAQELGRGQRAAPLIAFAETVLLAEQNRSEFERILQEALTVDINANPDHRLANLIAQKRGRWLLGRMNELFVE